MGYTKPELTPALKDLILNFVIENNMSPTGIWRDFHCVHRSWRNLRYFVDARLLNENDLPTEPDPLDYTDTASAATLQCPESCCRNCGPIDGCRCAYCSSVLEIVNGPVLDWQDFTLDEWVEYDLYDWQVFEIVDP